MPFFWYNPFNLIKKPMKQFDFFSDRLQKVLPLLCAALLSLCPSLFLTACGGDESTDDTYAAVVATTFTFNEEDPSLNRVEVLANTAWQVFWTPADAVVTVTPASGSGNGSFTVTDMPAGTTVQFGVKTRTGDFFTRYATVTREAAASENVSLSVTPSELTFDPAGTNQIRVTSNSIWTVSSTNAQLAFSPESGSGDGEITVTAAPVGQSSLTVTAGTGAEAKTATVTVSREEEPSGEVIFNLDFGNGSSGIWADTNEEWKTQTGTGASAVTYASSRMRINNDNYGSANRYPGASGQCYAKIFTDGDPGYFEIRNITLPASERNYELSFGTIFLAGDMNLEVSSNGTTWKALSYTGASTYNVWTKAVVGFTLAEPASALYIRYSVTGVQRTYGLNFDDVVLVSGGGGQVVDLGKAPTEYRWAELPAMPSDMTNKKINTHWASTVSSNQYLRNYTYCYDTYRHCPLWIAHPQHACYEEGSGRTDVWKKDPYMTDAEQAIIYPLPEVNGNRALSLYTESLNRQWTRGHMLMSNYRGGTGKEINAQTFYSCNIAPQGGEAFDKLWNAAEIRIQDNYVCADTLYCISGAYFENDDLKAYDASGWNGDVRYYVSGYSKECVVPTHYYKLVLRTRSGNTGKHIQECSANELKAVGFWFEHADRINGSTSPTLDKSYLRSVEWIEQKTGFTFFPDVPAEVKRQCNPSDWGF